MDKWVFEPEGFVGTAVGFVGTTAVSFEDTDTVAAVGIMATTNIKAITAATTDIKAGTVAVATVSITATEAAFIS